MIAKLSVGFLSPIDIQRIHDTSVRILEGIGVRVTSEEILEAIQDKQGFQVNAIAQTVKINEEAINHALDLAPSTFPVYGREKTHKISYGVDGFVCQAVPGEAHWVEPKTKIRSSGSWNDFEKSVLVADFLPNIDIIGAMIQPSETPVETRDIHLYAELFKRTKKPVRSWVYNRTSARYIIEMAKLLVGGEKELRAYPIVEFGFEPISPLILPGNALEAAVEFAQAGIPITIGPMPQAMATAPVTLAGALALGNTEILGTIAILQAIAPETPVIYYNAPHIMDPKEANLVFSSPEQAIMSVGAVQIGNHYGLPVGINVGLTDSKIPDAQAGLEKGSTMILGAIAGASIFGAMGIAGMDQGFSLPQLIIDDENIGFVKRVMKGMRVSEDAIAYEVIERVGISGNFLMDEHTLANWRQEFWIPQLCDRSSWESWSDNGGKTMLDRAYDRQEQIFSNHEFDWLDEQKQAELDKIVTVADREILGQ
jgi:trimethylamine---corrinoid protein Co-methyltransferase